MIIPITNRFTGAKIFECEAKDKREVARAALKEHVSLAEAKLTGANLSRADLSRANLSGAYLSDADLSRANLSWADLSRADLSWAYLTRANLTGANLTGANLTWAKLTGADLTGAKLTGANLSRAIMPYGETWEVYCTEVVPQLLTAGGRTLEEVLGANCWECHEWCNCPMAVAFDVVALAEIPALHRPRAEEFVLLFDAGLIAKPVVPAS